MLTKGIKDAVKSLKNGKQDTTGHKGEMLKYIEHDR